MSYTADSVDCSSITCHRLRHTMATQLLNNGTDIITIQDLLGHSEIELTMRCSRLSSLKTEQEYYRVMVERLETQDYDTLAAEVPPIRK